VAIRVVEVVVIVTVATGVVVIEVDANSVEVEVVDVPVRDSSPQETRPPALLCTIKGFPFTSVLSEEIEKTKMAPPKESVLL
jgi:hypothetical protein